MMNKCNKCDVRYVEDREQFFNRVIDILHNEMELDVVRFDDYLDPDSQKLFFEMLEESYQGGC